MDDLTLQLSRTVDAPRERVFGDWTRPEKWFWPTRINPSYAVDLRPGGRFRISSDVVTVSGEYVEVTAPERLVFTWHWEGEPLETLVTVDFVGATELRVTHEGHETTEQRDNHEQGWTDCLDRLTTLYAVI